MTWVWILVLPVALVVGVWVIETVRSGQQHRYGLRLEQLRARERLLERREAAEASPEPICGCGHHLAKHDQQHQRCHEVVRMPSGWDAERRPIGYEPGRCTCQRYVGPQPLAEIYAEEITDPDLLPGRRAGGGAELPPGAGDQGPDDQGPRSGSGAPEHDGGADVTLAGGAAAGRPSSDEGAGRRDGAASATGPDDRDAPDGGDGGDGPTEPDGRPGRG